MGKRARPDVQYHAGLGPSQLKSFAKIIGGRSIFITGSAGTGKSELIKRVTSYWEDRKHKFAVTATTGISSIGIGGKTLHSFMWLSFEDEDISAQEVYERLSKKPAFKWYLKTMAALQSLIIDEVSMLTINLFKKISDLFKLIRLNGQPFGGLQVILCGDFFQLPPVIKRDPTGIKPKQKFIFECPEFYQTIKDREVLNETFRQTQTIFVELLGRLRKNQLTDADIDILKSRVDADVSKMGIQPTELYSTNKDVDQLNSERLSQIKTTAENFVVYSGLQSRGLDVETKTKCIDKFLKDIGSIQTISLKPPHESAMTQVMLTYNLKQERGLVNGSRGAVIDFETPCSARSTHKSIFHDFTDDDEINNSRVYIKDLKHPKVRFIIDGHTEDILVPYIRIQRTVTVAGQKCLCYAWIMPLKLAWATTVHKSQGQSLDCLKVALDSSIFEEGQAYVAVSRARTLEGLTLTSFDTSVIKSNENVIKFYATEFDLCENIFLSV